MGRERQIYTEKRSLTEKGGEGGLENTDRGEQGGEGRILKRGKFTAKTLNGRKKKRAK